MLLLCIFKGSLVGALRKHPDGMFLATDRKRADIESAPTAARREPDCFFCTFKGSLV